MDNLLGSLTRSGWRALVKFRPSGRSPRQRQAGYLQPGAALSARAAAPGLLRCGSGDGCAARSCSTTKPAAAPSSGHYQLLLRNTVVYNLALQRSGIFYSTLQPAVQCAAAGLLAAGASNSTCSISTTARCFRWWTPSQPQRPRRRRLSMADASGSSGAQREEARLDGHWLRVDFAGEQRPGAVRIYPSALPGEDPDA